MIDNYEHSLYDFKDFLRFSNPRLVVRDLQTLVGILQGIQSDGIINESEKAAIFNWINSTKDYEHKKPYYEVVTFLREAIADNVLTQDEINNITWYCDNYINQSPYNEQLKNGILNLLGIIKGIVVDNEINLTELEYLDKWLEENSYLKNTWPYDELYNMCTSIIEDKAISVEEHTAFINFCKAIVGETQTKSNTELVQTISSGFFQIDPDITLQEKTFCLTGVSKKYKRREIAEKIELYGGFVAGGVSTKIDYLIVCDDKNSCWAFTCYGRKIEEVVQLRKKGHSIVIVHEYDLFDKFESL